LTIFLKIAPVAALIMMTILYMGKRDELATEIEACNTRAMEGIAEAERITREATTSALEARLAQLEQISLDARKARDIAVQARIEAESRPEKVRTIVRRVADEDACIDSPVHPDLLGCLRNDQDCGEARTSSGPNGL